VRWTWRPRASWRVTSSFHSWERNRVSNRLTDACRRRVGWVSWPPSLTGSDGMDSSPP